MKPTLISIVIFIVTTGLVYLAVAFIANTFNPGYWTFTGRLLIVVADLSLVCAGMWLYFMTKD